MSELASVAYSIFRGMCMLRWKE